MRVIDPNVVKALQGMELRPHVLLYFQIDGTDYRYTDCDVPITVEGNTYTPRDFEVQGIAYSISTIVDQCTFEIDNLDDILTPTFVGGTPQGSDVVVSLVLLNDDITVLVGSETTYFNFNTDLTATDGTDAASGYVVTMRPGEGVDGTGAVAVEEATTNEITDQSVFLLRTDAAATSSLVASGTWSGWYKAEITRVGTYALIAHLQTFSQPDTKTYTYSIEWYCPTGNIKPYASGTHGVGTLTNISAYRWVITWENTTGAASNEVIYFLDTLSRSSTDVTETVYYRYYQIEEHSFATSFVNGSRAAGALDYQTDLDLTKDGHMHFVVNSEKEMADHDSYNNGALCTIGYGGTRQLDVWMLDTGIVLYVNNASRHSATYSAQTEYTIDITWKDGGNPKLYIDGNLEYDGSVLGDDIFTVSGDGLLNMGRFVTSYVNSVLFNELYYSSTCPSDGQIAALYNSNLMPAITLFQGTVGQWSMEEGKINITITNQFSQWTQKTLSRHSASCRWKKFKGTECAYSGAESWCDRTYTRCESLGNQANFGGFRWLPSIVDKNVWWGKVPD